MMTADCQVKTQVPISMPCIVLINKGETPQQTLLKILGEYTETDENGIGRKTVTNLPAKIVHWCWYDHEIILAVIPKLLIYTHKIK